MFERTSVMMMMMMTLVGPIASKMDMNAARIEGLIMWTDSFHIIHTQSDSVQRTTHMLRYDKPTVASIQIA